MRRRKPFREKGAALLFIAAVGLQPGGADLLQRELHGPARDVRHRGDPGGERQGRELEELYAEGRCLVRV